MIGRLTSKLLVSLLVVSALVSPILVLEGHTSSEDLAASAISQAEEAVASAYEAVLEAERAKANISKLLDLLNVATKNLTMAHILYKLDDFEEATRLAGNSSKIGEEVRSAAEELKIEAQESWITSLRIRIASSVVGVIIVISGTLVAWRVFKRRYYRQA